MISKLLLTSAITLSSCWGAHHSAPARPAVVTIKESYTGFTDVKPPQRLDVIMNPGTVSDQQTRCDLMGGDDLVWINLEMVCEGVDY